MNIILDTNALLWLLGSDSSKSKLGKKAKQTIEDADVVYASAASILELRIKQMLGKIIIPVNLLEAIEQSGLSLLSISALHADTLKEFKDLSKHDPFDRILLAQTNCESAILLTADKLLLDSQPKYTADAKI